MVLGVCGAVARTARLLGREIELGPRLFPACLLLGWGAITMVTVTELRFSLPMLTVFVLYGAAVFAKIETFPPHKIAIALCAIFVTVVSSFRVANSARALVTW